MKNLITIFLLLNVSIFKTQNAYFIQKASASYTPLTGATLASGTGTWSPFTAHSVPIGFSFNYFGTNYSTIYCEGSGFCIFDIAFYQHTVHPYTVQMRDAGTGSSTSQSPITYRLDGTAPNRICKIQWANCETTLDLGSYANFQLWLYETSNIIEARVGTCTINNPAVAFQNNGFDGPLISIYNTKTATHYGYCVQGASPNETFLTLNTGTISNIFQNSMSAPPPSGMVYTFIPGTGAGMDEKEMETTSIYPNPTSQYLNIIAEEEQPWSIIAIDGKEMMKGNLVKGNNAIDLKDLDKGIYFLRNNSKYHKLIRE